MVDASSLIPFNSTVGYQGRDVCIIDWIYTWLVFSLQTCVNLTCYGLISWWTGFSFEHFFISDIIIFCPVEHQIWKCNLKFSMYLYTWLRYFESLHSEMSFKQTFVGRVSQFRADLPLKRLKLHHGMLIKRPRSQAKWGKKIFKEDLSNDKYKSNQIYTSW